MLPFFLGLFVFWTVHACFVTAVSDFDPYAMNGGLIAAVAGPDYVVLAADTRLVGNTGYDILSRRHVASRIWSARPEHNAVVTRQLSSLVNGTWTLSQEQTPVWIGSAGCQADCLELQKVVQSDLRAAQYFGEIGSVITPHIVASLLSQVLYQRRSFPFYSFCVVAGLSLSSGVVHVYDAIGSCEQVAVGTAGTGRELLQPILDRQFMMHLAKTRPVKVTSFRKPWNLDSIPPQTWIGDSSDQPDAAAVRKQVDCPLTDTIAILVQAYRAVTERHISVGDSLVLVVLQRQPTSDTMASLNQSSDAPIQCQLLRFSLKEH
jgi:20S proteasome subunit beta 6